jgi:hypothetical protein
MTPAEIDRKRRTEMADPVGGGGATDAAIQEQLENMAGTILSMRMMEVVQEITQEMGEEETG